MLTTVDFLNDQLFLGFGQEYVYVLGFNHDEVASFSDALLSDQTNFICFVNLFPNLNLVFISLHDYAQKCFLLQGVPKNCAPFAWLLWRSCRFNPLGFYDLHTSGFNVEFETLYESM